MREPRLRTGAIVALSLATHAAVLALVPDSDRAALRRERTPASTVVVHEPPASVDTIVDVSLLPEDTVASRHAGTDGGGAATASREIASHVPARRGPATRAPAIAATVPTAPEELPTAPPAPEKRSVLAMRSGPPEPLIHRPGSDGISDAALEAMVNGTIPVRIANLPGAREAADLERAASRLSNRRWVEGATPEQVTAARLERAAARQALDDVELVAQKDGTYTSDKRTFTARVNRDGSVDLDDKANWQQKSPFHAELDVTDAIMRATGDDPYAAEKRAYLDRTRAQRVEIGKRHRAAQLAASTQHMAANLARLWATTTDPAVRKAALFALWDECVDSGDEDEIAAGARARELVINWVHAKRVVFTPSELAAFNARRRSTATFAP